MVTKLNKTEMVFIKYLASSSDKDHWEEKTKVLKHLGEQIGKIEITAFKKNLRNRFLKKLPFIEERIIPPTRKSPKKVYWRLPLEINKQFTLLIRLLAPFTKTPNIEWGDKSQILVFQKETNLNIIENIDQNLVKFREELNKTSYGKFIQELNLSNYFKNLYRSRLYDKCDLIDALESLFIEFIISKYQSLIQFKINFFDSTGFDEGVETLKETITYIEYLRQRCISDYAKKDLEKFNREKPTFKELVDYVPKEIDKDIEETFAELEQLVKLLKKSDGVKPSGKNAPGVLHSLIVERLTQNSTFEEHFQVDECYKEVGGIIYYGN